MRLNIFLSGFRNDFLNQKLNKLYLSTVPSSEKTI